MDGECKQVDDFQLEQIRKELGEIKDRLGKIEKDVRGHGNDKLGASVRLDRLEGIRNWTVWIIPLIIVLMITVFLAAFFCHYFSLLEKR